MPTPWECSTRGDPHSQPATPTGCIWESIGHVLVCLLFFFFRYHRIGIDFHYLSHACGADWPTNRSKVSCPSSQGQNLRPTMSHDLWPPEGRAVTLCSILTRLVNRWIRLMRSLMSLSIYGTVQRYKHWNNTEHIYFFLRLKCYRNSLWNRNHTHLILLHAMYISTNNWLKYDQNITSSHVRTSKMEIM